MFYREDGGEWEVEVLSDAMGVDGMRRVRLRAVREIHPSPDCGSMPVGYEWVATVRPGYESVVGWSLHEEASS